MASPIITELKVTKKLLAFGERAAKKGLDLSVDLQQCIDDPEKMQRLVSYIKAKCPSLGTGVSYDAERVCKILGFPCQCSDPAPQAIAGQIVVYYGGWSLGSLSKMNNVTNNTFGGSDAWIAEAGYYRVLLPVSGSNRKTWHEQAGDAESSMLARQYNGWQVTPTPIAATLLAVHLAVTGKDLLNGDMARCKELFNDQGRRASIDIHVGRVFINRIWDQDSQYNIWLSAARKA